MNAESRIAELKLTLPPAPQPMGAYRPVAVVGNMAYVSGHALLRADGSRITGRLGADLERGTGARSAAGMSSLPGNIAVEIEAIFAVA